jgi:5'-nucleotidase
MKLLLTNDDGIDAPGLAALLRAAQDLGNGAAAPVVIAPVLAHSGCGHRVTTDRPLRAEQRGPGRHAVHGTPADCVRLAMHSLAPETTWVLSGINSGGNLGADIYHSGTVAAVREGAMRGWPGIAVSHYLRRGIPPDWERAASWTARVLSQLLARPWSPATYWNVNLPHLEPGTPEPEIVFCPIESLPLPLSYLLDGEGLRYNGDYHRRPRQPGTDVDICFSGRIAVTELRIY